MLTCLCFNVTRNVTTRRIFLLFFRTSSVAVLIICALRCITVIKFWQNIHPRSIYVANCRKQRKESARTLRNVLLVDWFRLWSLMNKQIRFGMPFVRRNVIIIYLTGLNGSPRATDTIFRVFLGMEIFMEYFRRARSCSNCHEHVNAAETRNLRDKSLKQPHGM